MSGMNNEPTPTTDFVLRDTDELLGRVDLEGGVTSLVVIEARTPGDVTVALAFYPGPPFVDPHVEELPSYVARMTSEQAVELAEDLLGAAKFAGEVWPSTDDRPAP